jgi:hypothetical protein
MSPPYSGLKSKPSKYLLAACFMLVSSSPERWRKHVHPKRLFTCNWIPCWILSANERNTTKIISDWNVISILRLTSQQLTRRHNQCNPLWICYLDLPWSALLIPLLFLFGVSLLSVSLSRCLPSICLYLCLFYLCLGVSLLCLYLGVSSIPVFCRPSNRVFAPGIEDTFPPRLHFPLLRFPNNLVA